MLKFTQKFYEREVKPWTAVVVEVQQRCFCIQIVYSAAECSVAESAILKYISNTIVCAAAALHKL